MTASRDGGDDGTAAVPGSGTALQRTDDRDLVWLKGDVKTPPFSPAARREAGRGRHLAVYRLDPDAVVIPEVFSKKTKRMPSHIVENCRARLKRLRV